LTQLDKVRDAHVRMSLELQQAFGLRREEAIKFIPSFADRGDHLVLKASWTKGGREAKTLTPEQRKTDRQARLTISRELGHEREQITAAYYGQ